MARGCLYTIVFLCVCVCVFLCVCVFVCQSFGIGMNSRMSHSHSLSSLYFPRFGFLLFLMDENLSVFQSHVTVMPNSEAPDDTAMDLAFLPKSTKYSMLIMS